MTNTLLKTESDRLKEFIRNYKKSDMTVGTLGPAGSSSEAATLFLLQNYFENFNNETLLLDSFEQCLQMLTQGRLDAAVVPHAYPQINYFYMNPTIKMVYMYRMDTPTYGLAVRADFAYTDVLLESETVLTHPAPISLMDYYCRTSRPIQYKLISSTSKAAQLVAEREYNLALTNENAKQCYNLTFVKEFGPIRMSWSMFTKGD